MKKKHLPFSKSPTAIFFLLYSGHTVMRISRARG